jgi:hypothetical protein
VGSPYEPVPPYSHPMIDLGSIEGLLEHDHGLAAYCLGCDRWSVLPLADLVAQGKGLLRLPIKVRCRDCGEAGRLQARPPVPTRGPGGRRVDHAAQMQKPQRGAGGQTQMSLTLCGSIFETSVTRALIACATTARHPALLPFEPD